MLQARQDPCKDGFAISRFVIAAISSSFDRRSHHRLSLAEIDKNRLHFCVVEHHSSFLRAIRGRRILRQLCQDPAPIWTELVRNPPFNIGVQGCVWHCSPVIVVVESPDNELKVPPEKVKLKEASQDHGMDPCSCTTSIIEFNHQKYVHDMVYVKVRDLIIRGTSSERSHTSCFVW